MLRGIKNTAIHLLQGDTGTYQHLIRVHSTIKVGAWLLLFALGYLIKYLAPDGGLSNLNVHSLLFTAQVLLILVGLFLSPFWETGLSYISLDFIRGRRTMSKDLCEGFRCLKPLLGAMAFQGIQYVLLYFISRSATGVVLTLLPFSQAFYHDAETLLQNPSTPLKGKMLIVAVVYGIVFVSLLLFLSLQVFFRYRITRPIILDDENISSMKASNQSRTLMKGKKKKLFQLDLSLWWFYIPEFLGILLPITVLLISSIEFQIPPHWETALWIAAALSLLLRLAVNYFAKATVCTYYAVFYDSLLNQDEEPTVEDHSSNSSQKRSKPDKRVPWQY